MLKRFISLLLLLLSMGLLPCVVAVASDYRFEIDISESYTIQENYLQRDDLELIKDLHFTRDRSYNLVHLRPQLMFNTSNGVHGYLGADFFWETPVVETECNNVSSNVLECEEVEGDEVTADFTTAYLSLKGSKVTMDVGLQPVQFGNGLIMADDTLAVALHIDQGNAYAEIKAAQVMDDSPIVGLSLGYRPGYFQSVELFGIWFSDQDDTFAYTTPIFYQVLSDIKSEGNIYYIGGAAELFVGDALLSAVVAYQTGRYTLAYESIFDTSGEGDIDVHAYLGDISLQKNLTDWFTAELFCFAASGDSKPLTGNMEAFVSITPYIPRAAIFFDPDFLDSNDDERLTFSGGFVGGVIAPGLSLSLASSSGFSAEASLIYLLAHEELPDGSRRYGWEVDFEASYTIKERYELFVEAARFEHGDYYEELFDEALDPAIRLSFGVRASF